MTSAQAPLPSGFGPHTTAREAIAGLDLRGKNVIVTGGYSGLGLEAAKAFADHGATVIVPARTPDKARAALETLNVEQEELDLFKPASVDAFAQRFLATGRALHALVNCAGTMAVPLVRDARGYESHFATNHLGHFQLAMRLWPALRKAKGSRVVSVSSRAHQFSGIDFEDPFYDRRPYEKWKAYGQSKTANVLFAVALDRRGQKDGVRALALHPGVIHTDLQRHMTDEDLQKMGAKPADTKTAEQGAGTIAWCAFNRQLEGVGGVYCEDSDVAVTLPEGTRGGPGVKQWAIDPALAEQLWTASEGWTGVGL
ncbi:MAG: SDR family NAD(P)-dependent oxidoreductase [Deltaproteobacteria bacterium]|nr:SDR family NAD(P)-dependent oxidoreductase [Deltaproteobacteria bacterium]